MIQLFSNSRFNDSPTKTPSSPLKRKASEPSESSSPRKRMEDYELLDLDQNPPIEFEWPDQEDEEEAELESDDETLESETLEHDEDDFLEHEEEKKPRESQTYDIPSIDLQNLMKDDRDAVRADIFDLHEEFQAKSDDELQGYKLEFQC